MFKTYPMFCPTADAFTEDHMDIGHCCWCGTEESHTLLMDGVWHGICLDDIRVQFPEKTLISVSNIIAFPQRTTVKVSVAAADSQGVQGVLW
jgi:hypothetical protein